MNPDAFAGLIGESPAMQNLRTLVLRVAKTQLPVLVEGPTGAGKEVVAQSVHQLSGRPGPLVAFNVCAIADAMFEDELFGHIRGAFTGAVGERPGYLAEAHHGTIFLDEIGSLPLPFQAKLLRVIETRQFRPVGGRRDATSDFRVVSATNEALDALVHEARFRRDLAQRLSGVVIQVPPLSARLDDIPLLADYFARQLSPGTGEPLLTPGATRALQAHSWPGNVRELRHVLERALLMCDRRTLSRNQIIMAIGTATHQQLENDAASFRRRRLVNALEQCEWDTTRAAQLLGVHRATIYRRMQQMGILRSSMQQPAARQRIS